MMSALLKRDVKLALKNPSGLLTGLIFVVVFMALSGIALGADTALIRSLAPDLIWLAVIFSLLMTFHTVFSDDFNDGTLEHLKLSTTSSLSIVTAKALSWGITRLGPIIVAAPIICLALNVPAKTCLGLVIALAIAAPALVGYGTLMGTLLIGKPSTLFLGVIMTTPLIIPVMIFGIASVQGFALNGISAVELRALTGLSLIAIGIALPASAMALDANME